MMLSELNYKHMFEKKLQLCIFALSISMFFARHENIKNSVSTLTP